jgi:hypothetical protein
MSANARLADALRDFFDEFFGKHACVAYGSTSDAPLEVEGDLLTTKRMLSSARLWPEATHLKSPSSRIDSVGCELGHHSVGLESRMRCFMKDDVSSNTNSTSATMTASSCLM